MKIGFTGSPQFASKVIAIYAVAMTAVAGGILLQPQAPKPTNVNYDLFKIGQTTVDQTLVSAGWKPIGYACQSANPTQLANGFGSTVCGYNYKTAAHNTITGGGVDWLMCRMASTQSGTNGNGRCTLNDLYIALSTSAVAPTSADCVSASSTCSLLGELASPPWTGAQRVIGTAGGITNDSSNWNSGQYTVRNTFTYLGATTLTAVQESGLFTKAASGTMVFANTFSSTNMVSGDTLQVTWTITV